MAYTTINKSTEHFNTVTYSGNNSTSHAITGVGHQPDLVWLKRRNGTNDHQLHDSVRGKSGSNYYYIQSNNNNSQGVQTDSDGVNAFNSDGFTVGRSNSGAWNESGATYVAWNWKANGSGSTNYDGDINSTVSANTTGGFSIVKYTGNGTANSTIGHGLGATPKFIIVKRLDASAVWGVKTDAYVSASNCNILYLDTLAGRSDDTNVFGTSASFTNSTFTVGDWNGSNASGGSYIAYLWVEKRGYSKFGSYTGNGNADGTFIYTGFKPAFIMIKQSNTTGNWALSDNKRNNNGNGNFVSHTLAANLNNDESHFGGGAGNKQDYLSNGFKIRDTGGYANANNGEYIYMAFAEAPLVGSNNVPCTAR